MNPRLLIALSFVVTISLIAQSNPLTAFLSSYFSYIIIFIVWNSNKNTILTIFGFECLKLCIGIIFNYAYFDSIEMLLYNLSGVEDFHFVYIVPFALLFSPVIILGEILLTRFVVKKLKLAERVGYV